MEKLQHELDKELHGPYQDKQSGKWYWWDKDWDEHGPFETEYIAERERLTHPHFMVYPDEKV